MKKTHFSFDLWLTLIKSHPEFKEKRDKMIWKNFNFQSLPLEDVSRIIKDVDNKSTEICEITGFHVPAYHMWYEVLTRIGHDRVDSVSISAIDYFTKNLFDAYPPILYDEYTKPVLRELYEKECNMNILSNTGFIDGKTLDKVLSNLGIKRYFNFRIYSDQCGIAKPNSQIFDLLISKIDNTYNMDETLHVGDNSIADGASVVSGIEYLQINSNSNSIRKVLDYL